MFCIKQLLGDERKSVRYIMEITAASLICSRALLIKSMLLPVLEMYDMATEVASSYMIVANYVMRWNLGGGGEGLACVHAMRMLAKALLPWVSHHSHLIR